MSETINETKRGTIDRSEALKDRWIVLEFGDSSLVSAAAWQGVFEIAAARLREGYRPLVVCAALAGVPDLLAEAYDKAVAGQEYQPVYRHIVQLHRALCESLHLPLPSQAESLIWKLRKQLVSCTHNSSPQTACKANVIALGELLGTAIGQAWMASRGCDLTWLDARSLLQSASSETPDRHYLSARLDDNFGPDLALRFSQIPTRGALTQSGIARDFAGETVLLGREGSDTTAACLATKLDAEYLESWTDVPGLFTRSPGPLSQARLLDSLIEAQPASTFGPAWLELGPNEGHQAKAS